MQFLFQFYLSPHLTVPELEGERRVGARLEKICGEASSPASNQSMTFRDELKNQQRNFA